MESDALLVFKDGRRKLMRVKDKVQRILVPELPDPLIVRPIDEAMPLHEPEHPVFTHRTFDRRGPHMFVEANHGLEC